MGENSVSTTTGGTTKTDTRRIGVVTLIVAGTFGLFFALAVWAAVGNTIRYTRAWAAIDEAAPGWLFALAILVPIGLYVLAFVVGRFRSALELAVLMLTALAVTSALSLAITALVQLLFTNLVLSAR